MSFLTAAYLMDKYGPLLTEEQLGEVLHMEPGTIRNQRGSGALGIPFIKKARTPLYRAEDVAKHIDQLRLRGG